MNRVTFTVKCRINQFRNEKFYVDYLKHDGVWIPMPIQVCDNSNNCTACQECVSDIINQARQTKPPFAE